MTDVGGDEPSFVWEVGQDLIDLDHWAQTYIALRVEEKESERSAFFRYGYWPIMALVVIVIGVTSSVGMAVALAVFLVAVFGGAKLWNRSAATRLAKRLHNLPAASEPFTFRASPSGTHSESESGSETLSWSRYKSARVFDEEAGTILRAGSPRGATAGPLECRPVVPSPDALDTLMPVGKRAEGLFGHRPHISGGRRNRVTVGRSDGVQAHHGIRTLRLLDASGEGLPVHSRHVALEPVEVQLVGPASNDAWIAAADAAMRSSTR